MNKETVIEAFKATPPVAVSGLTLFGVSLSDWVLILTAVYTVVSLFFLVWDRMRKKDKDNGSK